MNDSSYQGQYQGQYQTPPYAPPQGQPYQAQQGGYPYTPHSQPQAKSGFWTFCFAFIPGAGEMYLGHMKRGVSLSVLFFGLWWLSAMIISGLWITLPVIWMFSFFDTFNLRGHLAAGNAEPDAFMFHLEDCSAWQGILEKRHKVLGWALIVLGVWAIYDQFVTPAIWSVCSYWGIPFVSEFFDSLPALLLILLLILAGVWLVRGPQMAKPGFTAAPEDDIEYYAAAPQAAASAQAAPQEIQPNQPEETQDDGQH